MYQVAFHEKVMKIDCSMSDGKFVPIFCHRFSSLLYRPMSGVSQRPSWNWGPLNVRLHHNHDCLQNAIHCIVYRLIGYYFDINLISTKSANPALSFPCNRERLRTGHRALRGLTKLSYFGNDFSTFCLLYLNSERMVSSLSSFNHKVIVEVGNSIQFNS